VRPHFLNCSVSNGVRHLRGVSRLPASLTLFIERRELGELKALLIERVD
jgi:hypothetical protein